MTDTDNNNLLIEAIKCWKFGMELDTLSIMLLKKGVDVNTMDNDGITALMWASYLGHKEIVSMLLKKGADVNAKDRRNETALMRSAMSPTKWRLRQREIVSMLLEKGADVNAMDNCCFTALMWAYKKGNVDIVSMLQKKKKGIRDALPSLKIDFLQWFKP